MGETVRRIDCYKQQTRLRNGTEWDQDEIVKSRWYTCYFFLNEMINYLEYGKEVFFFLLLGKVLLLSKGQQERTTLG